ncbi:pentapeptide repeat-containing protein [Chryseobacterium gregarium]
MLEDLDLHRAKLENLNLTNTSFFKSNLRGAFLFNSCLIKSNLLLQI